MTVRMDGYVMGPDSCPACGSTHSFSKEKRQDYQLLFEKQLAALPVPLDDMEISQRKFRHIKGTLMLNCMKHEGCGISRPDDDNRTLFCAWVTDQVFHLGLVQPPPFTDDYLPFAEGEFSNVFYVKDFLDPKSPQLVLKEAKGLLDGLDEEQANDANDDVRQDFQNLSVIHANPEYTQSLKNRIVPRPITLLHGTYIHEGKEQVRIGYLAPLYENLFTKLDAPLTVTERRGLCKDVIDCVAAFHENNLVIGDLKPQNIYLIDGTMRIGDFKSSEIGSITITADYLFKQDFSELKSMINILSAFKGNPEHFRKVKDDLKKSMDIVALAITCYAIFTNDLPFDNNDDEGCTHPGNLDKQSRELTQRGAASLVPLFTEMTNSDWEQRPTIERVVDVFKTLPF
jgi:serine/threonine protein kinase